MDRGYVAFYFKLTCKEVAAALREQYRTIQLCGEPRVLQSPSDRRRWIIATAEQPWPGAAFVAHWGRPEPWRALPRWQRHRLLCLAASSHHPPSLDAALAHCGTVLQADALASAIMAGDLETCQRLYENEGCDCDHGLFGTAAGLSGSLPVCKWLAGAIPDNEATQQRFLLPAAILAGHERVVDWALERLGNDWDWDGALVGAAAKAGRLELMQRLAVRCRYPGPQRGEPEMLARVAYGCPLAVLQQYYEPWGRGLLEGIDQKLCLLLAAAGSPTPDWAAKCDWLWARWGAAAADAFGPHNDAVDGEAIAAVMQHTEVPQRLLLLASRGLGSCLERHAPRAAGAIGSPAAVEFCLDQLPALLRQQAAAPFLAAAGAGGPVAAAAGGGPLPAADPAAQQQVNQFMELIALAAAKQGHVTVLRLLRGRGFVFRARHLDAVLVESYGEDRQPAGLASLRYLLLEDPADLAQGGGAGALWPSQFAVKGADLSLLRHLHEQLGAYIHSLLPVAQGGGEDALSWTVAAHRETPEPLSCRELWFVLSSGNWAAAHWLVRHGLAPAKQELLRHMLSEKYARISELQWVVGNGGGQNRVQSPAQMQWTAELYAALVHIHEEVYIYGHETPCRKRWLAELMEAVAAELTATAGGRHGRGMQ
ncbi:hypothetical protein HXX76_014586 [Chlamydomonas incerta]|uniref:Uncharacterized protein n=1 Tax=Chlamydomonas incerta TaxID=51695 RepID=A0A835VPH1_CHLIN|nr:hypothetical protein HXX76_014586 [Chlamydomonas incerta]|eukprot:KAG2424377.1 hypothetical protein HXX76_014586 [Chlamydomonas incerta]